MILSLDHMTNVMVSEQQEKDEMTRLYTLLFFFQAA